MMGVFIDRVELHTLEHVMTYFREDPVEIPVYHSYTIGISVAVVTVGAASDVEWADGATIYDAAFLDDHL